jgi:Chaperone of endosialidase
LHASSYEVYLTALKGLPKMAKDIKKKLKREEFDLDDDFDMSEFGMDDMAGEFSAESEKKKTRSPVIEVFTGSISGLGEELIRPGFIAKTVEKSLPDSFETSFTTADKVISNTGKLYDQTIRELKPQLNNLGKKIDKLVPQEEGFLRNMTNKLLEATGGKDHISNDSSEQRLEQSIEGTLANVFASNQQTQVQIAARESVKDNIRDDITKKRFDSEIGVLGGIHDNVARLTSYNDTITQAFQKKSLELQIRSYFLQQESTTFTKRFQEVSAKQFESIARNTALPEFVKLHKSEAFKQKMQDSMISKASNKLFGKDSFIDNFFKNLTPYIGDKIDEIKRGIEIGASQAEELSSASEQLEGTGESIFGVIGKGIGGMGADLLQALFTPEIKKQIQLEFPGLKDKGEQLKLFATNPYKWLNKIKDSESMAEGLNSSNLFSRFSHTVLNDAIDLGVSKGPNGSVTGKKLLAGDIPSIAQDSSMLVSVTEVIPGYLARIYKELSHTRTGEDPGMTVFDKLSGKFKDSKVLSAEVKTELETQIKDNSYTYNKQLTGITNSILNGTNVTPEEKILFENFLKKLTQDGTEDLSGESIVKNKSFQQLPIELKKKAGESIFRKFEDTSTGDKAGATNALVNDIRTLKTATPDVQHVINKFIAAGQEEALLEMGIITQSSSGSYSVVMSKYLEFLNNNTGTLATSDVNVKKDIKKFSPWESLKAISKTPVFSWKYKQGEGDSTDTTKVGPMAQTVQKNFGDDVAPDGKKIDLVSLNGANMSAIQALNQKIDSKENDGSVTASDSTQDRHTELLSNIADNTKEALLKLETLGKIGILGIPNIAISKEMFGSVGAAIGGAVMTTGSLLVKIAKGTGKIGFNVIGSTGKTVIKGIAGFTNSVYNNKDKIDGTLRTVGGLVRDSVNNVGKMAFSALEKGTGLLGKGVMAVLKAGKRLLIDTDIYCQR